MEVRNRKRTLRILEAFEDFQGNLKQEIFTKVVPTEAKILHKIIGNLFTSRKLLSIAAKGPRPHIKRDMMC